MKKEEYYYHIEDGQFSFDFEEDYLIGKVGETVKIFTERIGDYEDVYIVSIEGNYVELSVKESMD